MNKLNNFTWTNLMKVIGQGMLMLIAAPIVLSTIVFVLNLAY